MDTVNLIQTTMNIAMVYEEMGKKDRALKKFENTLELGKNLQ